MMTRQFPAPPDSLPPAVLLGLDSMQGLQVARILSRHGVRVVGVASSERHYACRTRACEVVIARSRDELFTFLKTFGEGIDGEAVLIPCQDGRVLSVSRARDELSRWYRIVLPAPDVVEMLMDKVAFYTYAAENGFPIPETHILRSAEDAERAAGSLPFPAVLKPAMRTSQWTELTDEKAFMVSSEKDLLEIYDRFSMIDDPLIAQEWVPGGISELYSCNCYFSQSGELLSTFVARKLRQWPVDTGQSSLGEEVRDDTVLQESIRLLRSVDYRGLGYVEMKRDPSRGRYYIIEPNVGRPTGRSAIAEAGGVALHLTAYCDAADLPLPGNRRQEYRGVRWVHLRRDLLSAMVTMRRGEMTPWGWIRSLWGVRGFAVLSLRDPMPFIAEMGQAMAELIGMGLRRLRAATARVRRG
jgi:D-aspartate ligase